jgi:hypothetical protein
MVPRSPNTIKRVENAVLSRVAIQETVKMSTASSALRVSV